MTLGFSNDLSSILDYNLTLIKASISADAIATVLGLNNLNSDTILAALAPSFLKISKGTIIAELSANGAVFIIAFVEHHAVIASFATSSIFRADASRIKVAKMF